MKRALSRAAGAAKWVCSRPHTKARFSSTKLEICPDLQTRLLRVLQEREILRVGATEPTPIDVRIIAATHHDLPSRVSQSQFRLDLFYRLNILRLEVPSLRQRMEDLPELVDAMSARLFDRRRLIMEGWGEVRSALLAQGRITIGRATCVNSKISWSDLSPAIIGANDLALIVPELFWLRKGDRIGLSRRPSRQVRLARGRSLRTPWGRQMSANAYWPLWLSPVATKPGLLRLWVWGEPPMAQTQATWPDVISISLRPAHFSASEGLQKMLA